MQSQRATVRPEARLRGDPGSRAGCGLQVDPQDPKQERTSIRKQRETKDPRRGECRSEKR